GFLRFFIGMRRALNGEALDASGERNRPCDARAGAFDGVGDVTGGLVDDAMVKGLESNAHALSSHTKNNCLLMVLLKSFRPISRKGNGAWEYSRGETGCNRFFEENFTRHFIVLVFREGMIFGTACGKICRGAASD